MSLPSLKVTKVITTGGYPDALARVNGTLIITNGASNTMTIRRHQRATTITGFSYPFGVVSIPGPGRVETGPGPGTISSAPAETLDTAEGSVPFWGEPPRYHLSFVQRQTGTLSLDPYASRG